MISPRDTALRLDEDDDIVGAAAAYEELLSSGGANIEDLIAMALVYWRCADSGVAASKGISDDFELRARARLQDVLALAVLRDPANCEAKFWTLYCTFIMYFQPEPSEIDELLDSDGHRCEGSFATMWRVGRGDRAEIPAAQAILARADDLTKTSKGRYIASIIPAALTRLRLEDERAGQ